MYLLCVLFAVCSLLINPGGEVLIFSLMYSKYIGLYLVLNRCSVNILTDNRDKKGLPQWLKSKEFACNAGTSGNAGWVPR